nr:hypothetical protein [Desulfovibrio sp.]
RIVTSGSLDAGRSRFFPAFSTFGALPSSGIAGAQGGILRVFNPGRELLFVLRELLEDVLLVVWAIHATRS